MGEDTVCTLQPILYITAPQFVVKTGVARSSHIIPADHLQEVGEGASWYQALADERRIRLQGLDDVEYRGQLVDLDVDQLQSLFGRVAIYRCDCRDRITRIADLVDSQGSLIFERRASVWINGHLQ